MLKDLIWHLSRGVNASRTACGRQSDRVCSSNFHGDVTCKKCLAAIARATEQPK